MSLGPIAAPGTTSRTQQFGPAGQGVPGYLSQPEMYGSTNVCAYWQPYKGWTKYPHYHNGLDEAGGEGTPLIAAETIRVIRAQWDPNPPAGNGAGYVLEGEIRPGTTITYAHCSALLGVPVGRIIAKGQPVARIGHTGLATGNHCHFTLEIAETVSGVRRTILWNPVLWMAGGPYANDARIKPIYNPPSSTEMVVAFNSTVNGVNGRSAPDSRRDNVICTAWKDPRGIIRRSDGKKIGNTSSQRRLYRTVAGPDSFLYNELRIANSGLPPQYFQARFMHRIR